MSQLLKQGFLHTQIGSEVPVKALSWKQPYAELMLPPHNKIETRVWNTNYRGLVLICAGKKVYTDNELEEVAGTEYQVMRIIKSLSLTRTPGENLPWVIGSAIAIGRLVDCRPMTGPDTDKCFVTYRGRFIEWVKTKQGDSKMVDRQLFCHIYEDVHPIRPFEFKGGQKWTNLSSEQIKTIEIL